METQQNDAIQCGMICALRLESLSNDLYALCVCAMLALNQVRSLASYSKSNIFSDVDRVFFSPFVFNEKKLCVNLQTRREKEQ